MTGPEAAASLPEPPPPPKGNAPRVVGWIGRHWMWLGIIGVTLILSLSPTQTNRVAEEGGRRAIAATRIDLTDKGAVDSEEQAARRQAQLEAAQKDLKRKMLCYEHPDACQNGAVPSMSPVQTVQHDVSPIEREREEELAAQARQRYVSLWASPMVARRASTASSAAATPEDKHKPGGELPLPASGDPNATKYSWDKSEGPYHLILPDTQFGGTLMNDVNNEQGGPVVVQMDRGDELYVHGTQTVLVPEGAVVTCTARNGGDRLLAIACDQIQMPDGYTISLQKEVPAMGQEGSAGVPGRVNTHWLSTFGWTVVLGGIGAGAQIGNGTVGIGYSPSTIFRAQFSQSMGEALQQQLMQRVLNRPNSITTPRGTRVKFVTLDAIPNVPEWSHHLMTPGSF